MPYLCHASTLFLTDICKNLSLWKWFSTGECVLPPRGIWQGLEAFLIAMRWSGTTGSSGTTTARRGQRYAAKHPAMHRTGTTTELSSLNCQ